MLARLTRLRAGSEKSQFPLRTEEVYGDCTEPPVLYKSFVMTSDPIDPKADLRCVATSPVVHIEQEGARFKFTTETGSAYFLELV